MTSRTKINSTTASTAAAGGTKVSGVTEPTYAKLAEGSMLARGGRGVMIFRIEQMFPTEFGLQKRHATRRQWGAWRAYFAKLKINLAFFDSRNYYTVPAEWPHLFDADQPEADDIAAAGWYDQQEVKKLAIPEGRLFDAERIAQASDRKAAVMRARPNFPKIPDHRPRPKQSLINEAALFEEHDKAIAEMAAKRASRQRA